MMTMPKHVLASVGFDALCHCMEAYLSLIHIFLEKYKTLEPLEAIDILITPENIRKNLKSENDIYKFEYCSLDEKTYKIASYIPLEWKNGKLEKVLLASMDVTQEKKAEIESLSLIHI